METKKRIRYESTKIAAAEWQKKNYKRLGVKLYKEDAEAFEQWCAANGKSVNAALRECVSNCLGRPLENRTRDKQEEAEEE